MTWPELLNLLEPPLSALWLHLKEKKFLIHLSSVNVTKLSKKLSEITISFSSKDAKSQLLVPLSSEEPMNTCLMKSKGIFIINLRSLHDSICVAKRTLESGKVVAGGGAVDVALSIYLDQYCRNFSGK